MIIDLHIHSKSSDGLFSVEELVREAKTRRIGLMSITDHDSIACQEVAISLVSMAGIRYLSGVELNVTFFHPRYLKGKPVSLDILGYQFDAQDRELREKLKLATAYREERAARIMRNLNREFRTEGLEELTINDFEAIQLSVDGTLGRPHIADYLVKRGIVRSRQEAFDRYLVKCDVPKYPFRLEEASKLVRSAGGKVVLAHPNDPHGTSLAVLTKSLPEQTKIIEESILTFIDGVECWHSRNDASTTDHYVKFARKHDLFLTGGSDCHQRPVIMGTVQVPPDVAAQFA